jgi:hypothetical protein
MPKTYVEWLQEQNNELEADAYAGHLNFLNAAVPLLKQLDLFIDNNTKGDQFPNTHFSKGEEQTLREAVRIIKRAMVPRALIKKKDPPPPLILSEYHYDRRR